MSHLPTRIFLRAVALILLVFGVVYVADPSRLAGEVGILFDAVGATDVRATYGGVQVGFALFLFWAARRQAATQRTALVAIAMVLGSIALLRVLGPLLGDGWSSFHTGALVFEILLSSIALWLARRPTDPETAP